MLNEELTYKYNGGNDELYITFDEPSKDLTMSRYVKGSECLYKAEYKHLQQYAESKKSSMEAWAFLNKEFEEGRASEFSWWVIENVPVGHVDSDYFRP
jgi:hypothetical protein